MRGGSRAKHDRKGGPVGTEARALQNIELNARHFSYPPPGFVTPVEHSLLYNMISEPELYPEGVVKEEIGNESFDVYLEVKEEESGRDRHGVTTSTRRRSEGSAAEEEQETKVSYAQLSALLALSAEHSSHKGNDEKSKDSDDGEPNMGVPELLCKTVLKCVVKYANENDLDREHEIAELLQPVQVHAARRENRAAMKQILPFYLGYAATLVTLNPVPMLLGATVTNVMPDKTREERRNVRGFADQSGRAADVEKTGLLDEADDL